MGVYWGLLIDKDLDKLILHNDFGNRYINNYIIILEHRITYFSLASCPRYNNYRLLTTVFLIFMINITKGGCSFEQPFMHTSKLVCHVLLDQILPTPA